MSEVKWLEELPQYWHEPGDRIPSHNHSYSWQCISYPFCRIYWDWCDYNQPVKWCRDFVVLLMTSYVRGDINIVTLTRWVGLHRFYRATPDKGESDWYDPKWYGSRGKWQRLRGYNFLSYLTVYELPWGPRYQVITPRWDTSEFATGGK